jgi:hypothetical protein
LKRVFWPYFSFAALVISEVTALIGCNKPSDNAAFWWNWWVYALSASGALFAGVVAVFIDKLRAWASPPHLELRIRQARGNPGLQREVIEAFATDGRIVLSAPFNQPGNPSRWYHLRVWNRNRGVTTVHGVSVLLTEIWEERNGKPDKIWEEEVAMVWRHHPEAERTIGAPADADLCWTQRGQKFVRIETRSTPNSMPRDLLPNKTYIAVFRARGYEADSERFCVEIWWDGKFDEDEVRMAEHLKVRPARDPGPGSE